MSKNKTMRIGLLASVALLLAALCSLLLLPMEAENVNLEDIPSIYP